MPLAEHRPRHCLGQQCPGGAKITAKHHHWRGPYRVSRLAKTFTFSELGFQARNGKGKKDKTKRNGNP